MAHGQIGAPVTRVVRHGDFQPLNILADHGHLTGVIDWVKAAIAEPAFDYGAAIAIFATVPIRVPAGLHGMLRALMNNLARTHSRQCAIVAGNRGSTSLLPSIQLPGSAGHGRQEPRARKPAPGAYNSPVGGANLVNHVHRLTGLKVSLPA